MKLAASVRQSLCRLRAILTDDLEYVAFTLAVIATVLLSGFVRLP